MHRSVLLAVALFVVLSGCALPASEQTVDPDDGIGVVGEFRYDSALEVGPVAELSESELEAVTYRAMARLEVLRGEPFTDNVEVAVIDRDDLDRGWTADHVEERLWRALHVVGDDASVDEEYGTLYRDAVRGMYVDGTVVLVADEGVEKGVLVHELAHALQDQHDRIGLSGETHDGQLAATGLVEGEAELLVAQYAERCETEWDCTEAVDRGEARELEPQSAEINEGLFLSITAPYSIGTAFLGERHAAGGWSAVDVAMDDPPHTTAELLDPDRYPADDPTRSVASEATDEWERIGEERVGAATIFAALWYGSAIDREPAEGAGPLEIYNYSHSITGAWEDDALAVYEAETETAHVWVSDWADESAAERFAAAYREVLEGHGAVERDGWLEVPADEPYAGAYEIHVTNETVTVVGGPDRAALEDLRD